MDLLASSWNTQLPKFVSWLPQPGSWKTNAWSINWKGLQGYPFPPFNMIKNCLSKIILGFGDSDLPVLAQPIMVPDNHAISLRHSAHFSSAEQPANVIPERESSSTIAAYQSAWNSWRNWCHQRDHNPMSGCVNQALAFLTESFHAGRSYSTCNVYRSMLSTTSKLTGETDLGKHPQVVKLMAGIYNSRPPAPRYTEIWDPKIVIDHLRCMPNACLKVC